ncbi:class I SAM-dependent methyltransferase [bacterium]|nr:class I SAM-dependent methyltransferase [bacterium]
MRVVITCCGQKNGESLFYNGDYIDFISHTNKIETNNKESTKKLYFHPDDLIPNESKSWRDLIEDGNSSTLYNLNILPAYQLYNHPIYNLLFQKYRDKLYIFSAGWGVVQAEYKLPKYDITFSQKDSIPEFIKRDRDDSRFKDFNQLENDAETTILIAGKDYVLPFCELTKDLNCVKIIVYTSDDVLQNNPYLENSDFIFYHYKTDTESNWYYEFANRLINGEFKMPSKYDIYNKHAIQYDELVNHEDYQNNLQKYLNSQIKNNSTVLELGVGTGRVTKLYINRVKSALLCDRALHMINQAKINLKEYLNKIEFKEIDTREIDSLDGKFDLIIEGWSLGHVIIDEFDNLNSFLKKLIETLISKLNQNGKMIFIETYGSNVEKPTIPNEKLKIFYEILEKEYGFKKTVINTDYKFETIEDAKRVITFFFGETICEGIKESIVKEYTGVWEFTPSF